MTDPSDPWYDENSYVDVGVILSEKLNCTSPKVLATFMKG